MSVSSQAIAEPATPLVAPRRGQKAVMIGLTIIPFAAVLTAVTLFWNSAVGWTDLAIFAVMYVICGLGITVGYHRMLTHRAFEGHPAVKAAFLALGSMAIQGRAIDWAIDHRMHHAFSDREGDPHSPHHGFSDGVLGQLKGLVHAHIGWMFDHHRPADYARYAKDLVHDPVVRAIDRSFPVWAVLTFLIPFTAGFVLTGGSWRGAFTGALWGGLVRLFFNHHVTWSVNSICHFFGRRPYQTPDLATNNWLLALPSLGESWHHNHHVFPSSAFHGIDPRQVDVSGLVITALERVGLARNVHRVTEDQKARKRPPV